MPCQESECKCALTQGQLIDAHLDIFGICKNPSCNHPVANHNNASTATGEDPRVTFLQALKKKPFTSKMKVSDEIWRILENKFAARFQNVARSQDVQAAHDLYSEASRLPTFTTFGAMFSSGLSVDGPAAFSSESSSLFLATDVETSKPLIVKYPQASFRHELDTCRELKLANLDLTSPVVPMEVRLIKIRQEGVHMDRREDIEVLVMPRFSGSLADPITKLSSRCIFNNSQRIIAGINWVHRLGYVHMDLKGGNIFISMSGDWYLGDFGCCVRVNETLNGYTRWCYKRVLGTNETAQFEYDWYMLAVALFVQELVVQNQYDEVQAPELGGLKTDDGWHHIDHKKFMNAIAKVQFQPLRKLLENLVECKSAEFDVQPQIPNA